MICSSVKRDRLIVLPFHWVGLLLHLEEIQGVTSVDATRQGTDHALYPSN